MADFNAILLWVKCLLLGLCGGEHPIGLVPRIEACIIKGCNITDSEKGKYLFRIVHDGMTTEQVRALLGDPDMSEGHGPVSEDWITYTYSWYGLYITFRDGRMAAKDAKTQ